MIGAGFYLCPVYENARTEIKKEQRNERCVYIPQLANVNMHFNAEISLCYKAAHNETQQSPANILLFISH